MDILLEFAATGRIGAVRAGMPLAEAQELLGPGRPHPMLRMQPDASGYPYLWDSLSLEVSGGMVDEVQLSLRPGGSFQVPAALWPVQGDVSATVERYAFLAALGKAGYPAEPYTPLTLTKQSAVRTDAGTVAVFGRYEASEDIETPGYYLFAMRNSGQ
jgi:hypothetical protein